MKNLLFATLLIFQCSLYAQLNCEGVEYSVSSFTEDYNIIDEELANSLSYGLTWDDPDWEIPIGFDFTYFNYVTNELTFIPDLVGGGLAVNADAIKNAVSVILPAYADYTDLGFGKTMNSGEKGGLSNISYLTQGEEGSRIFILEWNNVGFYYDIAEGEGESYANFQLWIFEEDNSFEVRFGESSISDPEQVFEGAMSPNTALICSIILENQEVNGLSVSGDVSNPTTGDIDLISLGSFTSMPDNGRVLRFERQTVENLAEQKTSTRLMVSPVPFSDYISVKSDEDFDRVQLLDLTGNVLFDSRSMEKELIIDSADFPSSIYFLRVWNEGEYLTKKLVK